MEIVFLGALKPLRKTYTPSRVESYPTVKNFTSFHEEVASLEQYAEKLRRHAEKGHCMYKGLLKQPLNNESRRGLTDTLADTKLMVLDIDGLTLDIQGLRGKFNKDKLITVAESVISYIPQLADTSYVVGASSSCGMADSVRIHLHFFLDGYVSPKSLKEWIKAQNLEHFSDKLRTTPAGKEIKWLLDPCLADNSRIVFIAPPLFIGGVENPFSNIEDRVVYVKKNKESATISDEIMSVDPAIVDHKRKELLKKLHKAMGIRFVEPTYTVLNHDGERCNVVNNPNRVSMRYAYHNDTFCYYNIGPNGDSNAYYVLLANPTVVRNFKGEDPFLFEVADPDTYAEHLERFKDREIPKAEKENNVPMVFLEQGNTFLMTLYSPKEKAVIAEECINDKSKAELWFNHYGRSLPDAIPLAERRFDPTSTEVFTMDEHNGYTYVNTFRPTEYMRTKYEAPIPDVGYSNGWMLQFVCPTIYKIIAHMMAYDDATIKHFINWFAYIFQNRRKAETCWVLQGTQGTGKGAFYRNVCRPLWGEQYAFEKQLQNFEDDKNGWERYALLVLIDEINMKTLKDSKKTEASLKNLITDDERTIRAMRQEQVQMKSFMSVIMSTNDLNALNIPDNDRRYNVAPRQEEMLRTRYPEFVYDREGTDKKLAEELEPLAAFLSTYRVNIPKAFEALENQAKQDAREAGKSSSEAFFSAVRSGNLDYFTSVLEVKEVETTDIAVAMKCKETVKKWLLDARDGVYTFVGNEDLRHLYRLVEGTREMTSNKFGRLARANGVGDERVKNIRGSTIRWVIDKELLNAILEDLPAEDKKKFETAKRVLHLKVETDHAV
ncbi:primase-helicase family protein [Pasteurella multocida]